MLEFQVTKKFKFMFQVYAATLQSGLVWTSNEVRQLASKFTKMGGSVGEWFQGLHGPVHEDLS